MNSKQEPSIKRQGFLDVIFSWSLSDILNNHLYKFQVEEVPLTFSSTTHFMNSFINLLLEETRADLSSHLAGISQAPASPISRLQRIETDSQKGLLYHDMTLDGTKYDPRVGDLIAMTQVKPKCIDDLAQTNSFFLTACVTKRIGRRPMAVQIMSSHLIESNPFEIKDRPKGFVVYLTNLTTNLRTWQALTQAANLNVIERTLSFTSSIYRFEHYMTDELQKQKIETLVVPSLEHLALSMEEDLGQFQGPAIIVTLRWHHCGANGLSGGSRTGTSERSKHTPPRKFSACASHTEISSVDEFIGSGLLYARANTWCHSGFDAGSPGEAEDTNADDGEENVGGEFLQIEGFCGSVARDCDKCCIDEEKGLIDLKLRQYFDSFKLNSSQEAAVLSCLAAKNCFHENSCIKLIWGPPGTGKTKTVASLLFVLLREKHRTLTCAPTNIAVVGVAKRLLCLLSDHGLGCDTYGYGDIVLFGNKERMKINVDMKSFSMCFLTTDLLFLGTLYGGGKPKEELDKNNSTKNMVEVAVIAQIVANLFKADIANLNVRKLVLSLLVKFASGWRQLKKSKSNSYNDTRAMFNMLEIYNVDGHLHLVWSVDIVYENSLCVQVLKFWYLLSLSHIQQCAKRLESAFGNYTYEMISRCQTKRFERNLTFPMTWPIDSAHDPTLVLTSELSKLSLNNQTRSG
ncbi:hypothetical protein L1987_18453 [Smallanthus sonchifolius]|uniref:Uncharacterized protein n=1 Tax=Smallanthus sonchifolius TaxID=185202 RepID=A0ACB9J0U8_9ASTR|nr:hypothetical protein L1987_18453 [Smallanthus sonchifolius]